MVTIVTILHVFVCLFLIMVVLLQAGKGGGMGLAFGSTGAQTVFGGSGAGNLMTRVTAVTAVIFMLTSLSLAYFASANASAWTQDWEKQADAVARRERLAREKLQVPASQPATAASQPSEQMDLAPTPAPSPEGATPESAPAATAPPASAPAAAPVKPAPAAPVKPPASAPAPAHP